MLENRLRVLLVNSNRCRALVAAPPIGLAYVATAAADAGHDIRVTDLLFTRNPEKDLARALGDLCINKAIARNSNVVHSCEEGQSPIQTAVDRLLHAVGIAPPFWRFVPRYLRIPPLPYLRARYPHIGAPAI